MIDHAKLGRARVHIGEDQTVQVGRSSIERGIARVLLQRTFAAGFRYRRSASVICEARSHSDDVAAPIVDRPSGIRPNSNGRPASDNATGIRDIGRHCAGRRKRKIHNAVVDPRYGAQRKIYGGRPILRTLIELSPKSSVVPLTACEFVAPLAPFRFKMPFPATPSPPPKLSAEPLARMLPAGTPWPRNRG